jgi:hypothetical protein
MRKQACVFSLSLFNKELYARDKLSAITENCKTWFGDDPKAITPESCVNKSLQLVGCVSNVSTALKI